MDRITVKQLASGYDVGAIRVARDMNHWIGALDADLTLAEWQALPPAESADLIDSAIAKHLTRSTSVADGAGGVKTVTLADGSAVNVRKTLTGDIMGISAPNDVAEDVAVIARVSGVAEDVIWAWSVDDYFGVLNVVLGFR